MPYDVKMVVDAIQKYVDDCLFDSASNWPRSEIARRSYERWAAAEIIKMVKDNPDVDVVILIDDFIIKTDEFINEIDNDVTHSMFLIAQETAEDIGRLFV